jgi:hypothetical protein
MHDRSVLGPADVSDAELAAMVARLWGTDPAATTVLTSSAVPVDYDIPAITTAGRYWVRGTAAADGGSHPFELFTKHVQCWSRSPFFEHVPPEYRWVAKSSVPWRTEALAYRSDLRDRLPEGLTMPSAVGVFDLDEESAAIWLESVPVAPTTWDLDRFARAGHLLGRLAVSPSVAELRDVGEFGWHLQMYVEGRLGVQVLPLLAEEGIWQHPLVRGAFDEELRRALLAAADRVPAYAAELSTLPVATAHGDACPNNLLVREDSGEFVLIDYGFWGPNPIGFDLAQLLVGDVQVGRRRADDLRAVEDTIVPAYVEGLRAEGSDIPADVVRRAHALQLLLFTGLSAVPLDLLDAPPTPQLHQLVADRAEIARFSLDLLDATS